MSNFPGGGAGIAVAVAVAVAVDVDLDLGSLGTCLATISVVFELAIS
jgi:hypothetical protein